MFEFALTTSNVRPFGVIARASGPRPTWIGRAGAIGRHVDRGDGVRAEVRHVDRLPARRGHQRIGIATDADRLAGPVAVTLSGVTELVAESAT